MRAPQFLGFSDFCHSFHDFCGVRLRARNDRGRTAKGRAVFTAILPIYHGAWALVGARKARAGSGSRDRGIRGGANRE
jgi:hypothetical protein